MSRSSSVDTWERLVRYQRRTKRAMDRHLREACGHTLDDYDVLHQINAHGEPIRMGDLAERLLVANSSCNRIVGRLVAAGFVERIHGETDGRVVRVRLTTAGARLRRRMAAVHTRDIERSFGARLTAVELEQTDQILRRLLTD